MVWHSLRVHAETLTSIAVFVQHVRTLTVFALVTAAMLLLLPAMPPPALQIGKQPQPPQPAQPPRLDAGELDGVMTLDVKKPVDMLEIIGSMIRSSPRRPALALIMARA